MKIKLYALYALAVLLVISGAAFSGERESRYVREESARRNIALITESQAEEIALKRLNLDNARVKEIDLDNEADDYPNGTDFRPVYQIECAAGFDEYDVDVDAVTGEILKFKRDD